MDSNAQASTSTQSAVAATSASPASPAAVPTVPAAPRSPRNPSPPTEPRASRLAKVAEDVMAAVEARRRGITSQGDDLRGSIRALDDIIQESAATGRWTR